MFLNVALFFQVSTVVLLDLFGPPEGPPLAAARAPFLAVEGALLRAHPGLPPVLPPRHLQVD